jgi:SRSO17 transposase
VGVCQVAVCLSLVTPAGHAVIGRSLYLGAGWAADDERRELTGVPDEVVLATKPDLALALIRHAIDGGLQAGCVTAGEVYSSRAFRISCRGMGLAYVVAVPATRQVTTPGHRRRTCTALARLVPARAWARMRTGSATKGAKDYDWALLAVEPDDAPATADDGAPQPEGHSVLLVRRHRYTRKLAFFRCWTPQPVTLTGLVAIVCDRWHVEEDFQITKRCTGLDSGQVRTWTSWHRWSTAALTAYAILVAGTLLEHQATSDDETDELVPISCPELQHLLATTILPAPRRDRAHIEHWSRWRRRHQAVARRCHRACNTYADQVT